MPAAPVLGGRSARGRLRVLEWGLFGLVLLVLLLVFLRHGRAVQGQAELAALKTTVAALRTAAVLQYVQTQASGQPPVVAPAQRNPFIFLQLQPANYRGEIDGEKAASVVPGSWYFDPVCDCVAYAPLNPALVAAQGVDGQIRFRVLRGAGPWQFSATAAYRWQDETVE